MSGVGQCIQVTEIPAPGIDGSVAGTGSVPETDRIVDTGSGDGESWCESRVHFHDRCGRIGTLLIPVRYEFQYKSA